MRTCLLDPATRHQWENTSSAATSSPSISRALSGYSDFENKVNSTDPPPCHLQEIKISDTKVSIHGIYESESTSLPTTDDIPLLKRIRNLVEHGRIPEARGTLRFSFPGVSKRIDNWKRVLAVPKVQAGRSATGGDLKSNSSWLDRYAEQYKGMWVALKEGTLLAANKSRIELYHQLKQENKLRGALFVKIP